MSTETRSTKTTGGEVNTPMIDRVMQGGTPASDLFYLGLWECEVFVKELTALLDADANPSNTSNGSEAVEAALQTELGEWKRRYFRVADAVAPSSENAEHLASIARNTRAERDAAKKAVAQREQVIAMAERMLSELLDTDAVADDFAHCLPPNWFEFAERIEALRDQCVVNREALGAAAGREVTEEITHFVIPASAGLDPIRVLMFDHAPGKGTLIVECYGEAWSCSFGAMGNRTIMQFVASVDRHYLGGEMGTGNSLYRERIANAVILAARDRVLTAALATER